MAKGYSARRGFSNGAGQAAQQMQMQQKLMQMQQEMAKAQQEVEEATFTASVGGGAVSAAANGKKEITALTIKPEAVDPEDVEMLQDLVISRGQRGAAAGGRRDEQPHEQLHQRSEHPRSGAVSAEYSKETPPTDGVSCFLVLAQAFAGHAQRPAQEDGRERQTHELGDGE